MPVPIVSTIIAAVPVVLELLKLVLTKRLSKTDLADIAKRIKERAITPPRKV